MDKWLQNTNVVKVLALALGILLWTVVRMAQSPISGPVSTTTPQPDKILGVPITTIYDANKYYLRAVTPSEVMIKLKGSSYLINAIKPDSYKIVLDLSNEKSGSHQGLPLKAEGFPKGVTVEISPAAVDVVLEELQKKELPIDISVNGTPAKGYKAGQPVATPSRVFVTAPSSQIDKMASVKGEIDVTGAKGKVSKLVKLAIYDKNGKEVEGQLSSLAAEVEVPITLPFKSVPLRMKTIGQPPAGYSVAVLTPNIDHVTIYGPQEVLDQIDFYNGVQVNLANLQADQNYELNIPLEANIEKVEPNQVSVQVKVVASAFKVFEKIPITIIGQNNDYSTAITNPQGGTVRVPIEAAPAILDKLKDQDIQAIVDVSNLPTGTHQLSAKLNLPQFVKAGKDSNAQVTVEISAKPAKAAYNNNNTSGNNVQDANNSSASPNTSSSPSPTGTTGSANP